MTNVKGWLGLVSMVTIVCGSATDAAERSAKIDWKARINQLAKPAADEVVLTATGDALWNRSIVNSKDPGLLGLFDVIRASDISFANFEQVLADNGFPVKDPPAMANPAIISDFVWSGLDLVSRSSQCRAAA